ncbi:MAG: T9SS type A sorting domain-containing protein [Sphingobacteriaceae bacterium]|nr:T9SS type A sorting domain-containing protein [Sphingobacteriaceae bacterium]
MKKIILSLYCIFNITAHAQNWVWAYPFTSYSGTQLMSLKLNSAGLPYVMGWSQTKTTFNASNGPFAFTGLNTFVTKLDNTGNVQWIGGGWGSSVWGRSMSIDKYSNCFITGQFGGNAYFGIGSDTLHRTASTLDYFLTKLDANGKTVFFKHEGDTCDDLGTSVTAFQSDEIIVTWTDQLACDNNDAFKSHLKKMNSSGNDIWSLKQPFDGLGSNTITYAPNNGFLVSGSWFGSTLKLEGISDTLALASTIPNSISDVFLAKYSISGNPKWVKAVRGNNYQFVKGLTANNSNIYMGLDSWDSCFYDNILLIPKATRTHHIIKTDSVGNYIKHIGFPESLYPTVFWLKDLKSDDDGNVYLLAQVDTSLCIGNDTIHFDRLPNEQALAIIKLDQNLNYIWSQHITFGMCNCWGGELAITDSLVYVGINYDAAVSLHGSAYQFPAPDVSSSSNCFVAAIQNGSIPSSIKEITEFQKINIFPNPTSGKFVIRSTKLKEITVRNILGKKLIEERSVSGINDMYIDLSQQPKGVYLIEILSNEKKAVRKIIIE